MARDSELPDVRAIAAEEASGEDITSQIPVDSEPSSALSGEPAASSAETGEGGQPSPDAGGAPEERPWHLDLGPEYEGLTEEQAIARIEQERQAVAQIPHWQAQAREAQEAAQRYQQQLSFYQFQQAQAAQQAAAAKAAEQAKPKQREVPPWKPEWQDALTVNEKGQIVPKEFTDPSILSKYNDRKAFERAEFARLVDDPAGYMMEFAGESIQQAIAQQIQQHISVFAENQAVAQFEAENRDWLWENRQTGQPSYWGQMAVDFAKGLVAQGVAKTYAMQQAKEFVRAQALAARSQQPAAPTPQQAQQAGNEQFLRKAAASAPKPGGNRTNGRPKVKDIPRTSNGMPDVHALLTSEFANAGADLNGNSGWR